MQIKNLENVGTQYATISHELGQSLWSGVMGKQMRCALEWGEWKAREIVLRVQEKDKITKF